MSKKSIVAGIIVGVLEGIGCYFAVNGLAFGIMMGIFGGVITTGYCEFGITLASVSDYD